MSPQESFILLLLVLASILEGFGSKCSHSEYNKSSAYLEALCYEQHIANWTCFFPALLYTVLYCTVDVELCESETEMPGLVWSGQSEKSGPVQCTVHTAHDPGIL